jgi:hypothetical protein
MARRRVSQDDSGFTGLDSFMDIVTNVVGAMFFVVVYASLSSLGARGLMSTPRAHPVETERTLFECRGNTVCFPDLDGLTEKAMEMILPLYKEGGGLSDPEVERINDARVSNRFYQYRFEWEDLGLMYGGVDVFTPLQEGLGEDGATIEWAQESNYRRKLHELDPARHHVIFLVRSDSFEVFQTARRIAIDEGFEVGWEPLTPDEELRFSSWGGRPLDVY